MTNEQFDALVARLEAQARRHPRLYALKVLGLAALGNAYIGFMLLIVAGLFLLLLASLVVLKALALKLVIVVGFFLWMLLKALWVRVEPPRGTRVTRRQVPELFATIDELRRRLRAPRFHRVLVTDEFNAGVVQRPRLGIFGWPSNYLLLGLPLMRTLSVEQFKSVLAHELGHLARGHGRTSNWVYRQRLRWSRLMHLLEANGSKGGVLFKPFLNRFAPYFNAYSFPMARANEYEADATAARLTSPRAAAEALTGVSVLGRYLAERYWPAIHRLAEEQPHPAFGPYSALPARVAEEIDPASAEAWLAQALAVQTSSADTHPALRDRLAAIGEGPRLAPPAADQAADRLLGGALDALAERFDERWRTEVRPAWEQRYREVQEGRRRLAELERLAGSEDLELRDAFDRAMLTESVGGDAEAALAQLRVLHERAPDNAVVAFSLGARLLMRDQEDGCELIEQAMRLDEEATLRGAELLRDYHWRHGREQAAQAWHRRLVERARLEQAAREERSAVRLRDRFEPHGLPAAPVQALIESLEAVPGLRRAYLVRKRVQHLAHRPYYVLGFAVTAPFRLHSAKRARQVSAAIQARVAFPGETLIINIEGDNHRFHRKLKRVRGSRLV